MKPFHFKLVLTLKILLLHIIGKFLQRVYVVEGGRVYEVVLNVVFSPYPVVCFFHLACSCLAGDKKGVLFVKIILE